MHIVKKKTITDQYVRFSNVKQSLEEWLADAERAVWTSPQDVKNRYPNASILAGNRVVFNIKGNTYRLIVSIAYRSQVVYIKFFGTHAEYDKIDALSVNDF